MIFFPTALRCPESISKVQTETELREQLEDALDAYTGAMQRRRWSVTNSALTAFVIPAIDIFQNPSGNHLLSLAAGAAIAISKIRLELLEGEAKAPGRECAYIFDAQQRFGSK